MGLRFSPSSHQVSSSSSSAQGPVLQLMTLESADGPWSPTRGSTSTSTSTRRPAEQWPVAKAPAPEGQDRRSRAHTGGATVKEGKSGPPKWGHWVRHTQERGLRKRRCPPWMPVAHGLKEGCCHCSRRAWLPTEPARKTLSVRQARLPGHASMASVPSTSSGRRAACEDRNQLNSIKHVPETSASLPISPGAPPVGDLVRGKEAKQKSQENGSPLWRLCVAKPSVNPGAKSAGPLWKLPKVSTGPQGKRLERPPLWRHSVLRPSVEGGFPGASPAEAKAWGKDKYDAGSWNSAGGIALTPGKSSRPLPFRPRRPPPARCRHEALPKARAKSPRTRTWATLSGAAPARAALSGKFSVTAHLSGKVATCQPRACPIPGASLRDYSVSGIPGSYRSHGIHEPSSRLCCPGGSFGRSQSAGCEFVPMPKTARPEGGCLTIHQSSSHPLPFWLKR
jgi:hypothetical protein